jgi:hypothetical protein
MEIKNIRGWAYTPGNTTRWCAFSAMSWGCDGTFEEPATVEFETTEGDEVQVMGPGHPYFDFFDRHARGPVPLFEVDDLGRPRQRLVEARTEIVGSPGRDSNWEWLHFRAPDGHLYEMSTRLPS